MNIHIKPSRRDMLKGGGALIVSQLPFTCFLSYTFRRFALAASHGGSWAGPSTGGSPSGPPWKMLRPTWPFTAILQDPALNGQVSPKDISLTHHIQLFFKISIKERSFDIHLPDFIIIKCGNC
jgi:hypothetical protein